MICQLFIFRHSETTDNRNGVFSGWRDPHLTSEGFAQAHKITKQLECCKINYAFTSHLKRATQTLSVVLKPHPEIPIFVDDRLIERCYGLFQGKSKKEIEQQNPHLYAQFHRGYYVAPPEGESMAMVESRVIPFFEQLTEWLNHNPGNVAISCHNNSIRVFRRLFESLSLNQMCEIENPQDKAFIYNIEVDGTLTRQKVSQPKWDNVLLPKQIRLATDPRNPLRVYY
ncbi:MAG: histidine phosphatase family protein [Candidatus Bathyarchaeota archaeon]|nr:histidine phosphatase family protein [Candidatus Bathyarchaeota archaeon]